jgi:hypothetical protein
MDGTAQIQIPRWIVACLRALAVVVSVIVMLYAVLLLMEAFMVMFERGKLPLYPVPPLAFHIGSHLVAGFGFFLAGGLVISGVKRRSLKIVLIGTALAAFLCSGIVVLEGQSLWTLQSA